MSKEEKGKKVVDANKDHSHASHPNSKLVVEKNSTAPYAHRVWYDRWINVDK